MTAEKAELPTNPDAAAVNSDKRLRGLVNVRGAGYLIERLVRSIVCQLVEAPDAFVN